MANDTLSAPLDLADECDRLGGYHSGLYDDTIELLKKLDLPTGPLRPRDSLAIRTDSEMSRATDALNRYRKVPEADRSERPALKYAAGKLELATGDYLSAWELFCSVAASVAPAAAKGEAQYSAFLAALERRNNEAALSALAAAAKLDPRRFTLFPMDKYLPERIVGSGGFGVSILCKVKDEDERVVVKALWDADLTRGAERVFAEARALAQLDHPHILKVKDCGYADTENSKRPYLVSEYFESQPLDAVIREEGTLETKDVLFLAARAASALVGAHQRNIIHRGLKPANLLVRHRDEGKWDIKIADFGIVAREPEEIGAVAIRSVVGSSLAATLDCAAPEQRADYRGDAAVGPESDLYSLAKTFCLALFQTPNPTGSHWEKIPAPIVDLLQHALNKHPDDRPESMKDFLAEVQRLTRELTVSVRYVPAATTRLTPAEMMKKAREREEREEAGDYDDEYDDYDDAPPPRPRREEEEDDWEDERDFDDRPPARGNGRTWVIVAILLLALAGAGGGTLWYMENKKKNSGSSSSPNKEQVSNHPSKTGPDPLIPEFPKQKLPDGFPPNIDPPKFDPPKFDPPKFDPPKFDPPKNDPPKVDPPKTPSDQPLVATRDTAKDFLDAPGAKIYLADLPMAATKPGSLPVGADGHFGNTGGRPGKEIIVEGKSRPKGIGMRPQSGALKDGFTAAAFNLARKASTFEASVTLDDSVLRPSSPVTFQVIADGKRIWESAPLALRTVPSRCELDVTGVELLELRVSVARGYVNAYAVWVDPFVWKAGVPKIEPKKEDPISPNDQIVFLSDLKEIEVKNGTWPVTKGGRMGNPAEGNRAANAPIIIKGERCPHGIGMHPPVFDDNASIQFRLGGKAKRFASRVSNNDTADTIFGSGVFLILGDGKELWKSNEIKKPGEIDTCNIDVAGIDVLELRTTRVGTHAGLHLAWLDPRVTADKDVEFPKGKPVVVAKKDPPKKDDPPSKEDPKIEAPKGHVFLSDLKEDDYKDGTWPITKNGKLGDAKKSDISIEGELFPKGICMHPPNMGAAGLSFIVDSKYERFKGKVALNDGADGIFGPVVFEIYVNKKRVWQSKPMQKTGRVQEFDIDISRAKTLAIQTVSNKFSNGLHAVWLDPVLKLKEEP